MMTMLMMIWSLVCQMARKWLNNVHVAEWLIWILCSWVHASWINVNNCPPRCDYIQFIIFPQTALHVSGDTFTHHQEHMWTVITASSTGRTVFATFRCRGGVVPPRQGKVANKVWPVPDAVITVYVCSWWWVKVSPPKHVELCLQKYNKIVYNRILLDNCWHSNSARFPSWVPRVLNKNTLQQSAHILWDLVLLRPIHT